MDLSKDFEIFLNKRPDRVYYSPRFTNSNEDGSSDEVRVFSKVFVNEEHHEFYTERDKLILRVTEKEKQEVVVTVLENNRSIRSISLQRYYRDEGKPIKQDRFTFRPNEFSNLLNFLRSIEFLPVTDASHGRYDDSHVAEFRKLLTETPHALLKMLNDNPDVIADFAENNIESRDIVGLKYRKNQLAIFNDLLSVTDYFEKYKATNGFGRDEDVWQNFFERNQWIFGYGLNYIFSESLQGKKLEQVTSGATFAESGKRADALMKTKGLISTFCLGEIKTSSTPLLKRISTPPRPECWPVSPELIDAIAQSQRTVRKFTQTAQSKIEPTSKTGEVTGETIFLHNPRSVLLIGNNSEFIDDNGRVNEQKFSSFELFRRSIVSPEIITFDELYERAKFIVESHHIQ